MNYLIYLLSLLLMLLLSSCRSPKTMTTSNATADSVKISLKDSTTNHFSFTFDSLLFSTTELTELTDAARSLSVCSVSSVVNKNTPCSRLVIYGGKLLSERSESTSHDSTSSRSSSESRTTKIRSDKLSSRTLILSLLIISSLIFIIHKIRSKVLS